MLPDSDDDGSLEASCARNTGIMILCLIELEHRPAAYDEAIAAYFDSVDFKVHDELGDAAYNPTEEQIAAHPLSVRERAWFESLSAT